MLVKHPHAIFVIRRTVYKPGVMQHKYACKAPPCVCFCMQELLLKYTHRTTLMGFLSVFFEELLLDVT